MKSSVRHEADNLELSGLQHEKLVEKRRRCWIEERKDPSVPPVSFPEKLLNI